jgi:predicted ester cyclase
LHAFLDPHVTIEVTIGGGEKVITRLTWRGTHTGKLVGMPPTGNQVAFSGMESYRFAGDKIVDIWACSATLGKFEQFGMIPPMG